MCFRCIRYRHTRRTIYLICVEYTHVEYTYLQYMRHRYIRRVICLICVEYTYLQYMRCVWVYEFVSVPNIHVEYTYLRDMRCVWVYEFVSVPNIHVEYTYLQYMRCVWVYEFVSVLCACKCKHTKHTCWIHISSVYETSIYKASDLSYCCQNKYIWGISHIDMGWLRLVGSLISYVSFAKEPYERDDILQKRPIILRSLLIVATPRYVRYWYIRRGCVYFDISWMFWR